jgi:hypothetical protein
MDPLNPHLENEVPPATQADRGQAEAEERRNHPRFEVETLVPGRLLYRARARAMNLSLTGIALEAPERLEVGRSHQVRLTHRSGGTMDMHGRIVWCHMLETIDESGKKGPSYRAGLEFEQVLSTRARKMQLFLESQADMSRDQRIFGRFDLDGEPEIHLATRYEFNIRTVSRSGLSIESEYLPPVNSLLQLLISLPDRVLSLEARVVQIKPTPRRENVRTHEIGLTYSDWPADFDPLRDLLQRAQGVAIARDPAFDTPTETVFETRQIDVRVVEARLTSDP